MINSHLNPIYSHKQTSIEKSDPVMEAHPAHPSEHHLRIIFDFSHCQNIHSQSQNCCFKNFLIFGKKIVPQSARICAIGGVKLQFGQCPNIHGFFWVGLPLVWKRGVILLRQAFADSDSQAFQSV